ncbi:MAG: 13E12 repeat family protein [Actinomycetota bacterium]|nr:13E12 repeat family protein [Actinomycetota bacterium]
MSADGAAMFDLGLIDRFVEEVLAAVECGDGRVKAAALGACDIAGRKLQAAAATVGACDRAGEFRDDGHVSVRGWIKASVRVSDAEVTHHVRVARLCADLPVIADELAAGRLGIAQARELARARANPRCGHLLSDAVGLLLEAALHEPYEIFVQVVRQWERLADGDGAHDDHEAAHAARRVRLSELDDTTYLDGRFGNAQGAAMRAILDRFTQAEFDAEWDELRARLGDDACPTLLARSHTQRCADAVYAIFQRAAAMSPGAEPAAPVVNYVISADVFDEQLAAMVTDRPADFDHSCGRQWSMSAEGDPVDPADIVAAALIGHIRRLVVNTHGVIIDFGRRARVFTGAARDAALLQAILDTRGRCLWPGCGHHHTHNDHTDPWGTGGHTELANTGPLCPRHNRYKTRGYRTWRDPHGHWHTYRPDGTEIAAA